jgi:hypothetical protein
LLPFDPGVTTGAGFLPKASRIDLQQAVRFVRATCTIR